MLRVLNSLPRQTCLLAVLLGIAGDQLTWGVSLTGPALLIWLGSLILAAVWLAHARSAPWCRQLMLWGGVAVLAAALRLLLALPIVDLALFAAITAAAAQILLRTAQISFRQADVYQQLLAHVAVPLQTWFGGFAIVGKLEVKLPPANSAVTASLRGLLLAIPLLLVFTLLFAAADITFENYLGRLPEFFSLSLLQHLLLALLLGWLALGLLAAAWQPRTAHASPVLANKLGDTETLVMMGLLAVLFISFAALQASHLLRDGTGIAQTTGLTIAEYARHGFFQLLWIAALALLMLLLLAGCCRNQRLYAGFAALLLVCVLIVLASAVQRMQFYIDSFGFSIDRVVASVVMLWLAGSLLLFAATVLRNQAEGFASGVIALGIAVCVALALANPAALVTRVNIERSLNQRQALDLDYLYNLGADAVPGLLTYFPQLSSMQQCEIGTVLIGNWLTSGNDNVKRLQDWRRWNHAYSKAHTLVQASSEQLLTAARRSGDSYYDNVENFDRPAPAHPLCQ